jgi:hypothetical protein
MLEQIAMLNSQLGFMRIFFGVLAGTAKKTALQDWLLEQMNAEERPGRRKTYKDLDDDDKEGFDKIVGVFENLKGIFDEAVDAKAVMCYKFYKSLQNAGFTPQEAIAIVAAQGAEIMKTSKSD